MRSQTRCQIISTINVFLGTSVAFRVNPFTLETIYSDQEGKEQLFDLAHRKKYKSL